MKRKAKVSAETQINESEDMLVLTPSGLLAFLAEIEELSDLDIAITEEGKDLSIKIGDNNYILESQDSSAVEVDEDVLETIDTINDEGYDELSEDDSIELEPVEGDNIEGGIIKELIKTLTVGGLVRMTKNAIANS